MSSGSVHTALGGQHHPLIERHQQIGQDQVLGEFYLESHAGGVFGDLPWGGAEFAFFGSGEFLGFGGGVAPDDDFVSGAQEITRHGVPHESESEES
jgi:hypothetical protein